MVSSPHHTHTPHPLWRADGIRLPGEEGGDGDYGWGEQGPSSPHLLHAETTQKALSLPSSLVADSYHMLGWLEAQGVKIIKLTD